MIDRVPLETHHLEQMMIHLLVSDPVVENLAQGRWAETQILLSPGPVAEKAGPFSQDGPNVVLQANLVSVHRWLEEVDDD